MQLLKKPLTRLVRRRTRFNADLPPRCGVTARKPETFTACKPGLDRLLREWRRFAPGLPPAEQAQRALDAVAGVDLNPFAVEIARFRLLLAALRAADVRRLTAAPGFRIHIASGDSLLHGKHFFRHELGGTEEGFRRVLHHRYLAEDAVEIDHILGRQYHAVVGNPPYITPKDPAMRDAYRDIYVAPRSAISAVARPSRPRGPTPGTGGGG
jgi:hypothetical protein